MNRLELREQILDCERCELHEGCRAPVPFTGPTPATYAVIGEAPGQHEDQAGKPFVGPSGQLLREALVASGLDPERAFILNTVSCNPPGNRTPRPIEVHACRDNWADQLELSGARFVLALGSTATAAFRSDLRVTTAHGQIFSHGARVVMVTFHPSAALHQESWKAPLLADIAAFARAVETADDPNPIAWHAAFPDRCGYCPAQLEEMEEIRFDSSGVGYCQDCWPRCPAGRDERAA